VVARQAPQALRNTLVDRDAWRATGAQRRTWSDAVEERSLSELFPQNESAATKLP
jgi:hypothetical protein